jgi:hypothetical protein
MKRRAPKRTGALAESIRKETGPAALPHTRWRLADDKEVREGSGTYDYSFANEFGNREDGGAAVLLSQLPFRKRDVRRA